MKIQPLQRETTVLRAPTLKDILPTLLLFVISRGTILGLFPFGLALFAASFDKSIGYLGITAMYLGMLTAKAGSDAIKYIMAGLCFWIYTKIIPEKFKKTGALGCALCLALGGLVYMLQTHFSVYGLTLVAIEAIVCYFLFEVFSHADAYIQNPSKTPTHIELVSCAVLLGTVTIGTVDIVLPFSIHPSIILAIYALLVTSYSSSASLSGAAGVVVGFVSGLNSEAITLAGVMGIGVMLSSILKPFKKPGIICGFLGGMCISLLYVPQSTKLPLSPYDSLIAAFAFSVTPKRFISKLPELFSSHEYTPQDVDKRAIAYIKRQISSCADAFLSLQKTFSSASTVREELKSPNPETLFDSVCKNLCSTCPGFTRCYECSFETTHELFRLLYDKFEEKGTLNPNVIPLSSKESCIQFDSLCSEFAHRYALSSQEAMHLSQMRTGRDLCALQYGEIADILQRINTDIDEGFACCDELEYVCANTLLENNIEINSISISENRYGKYEILLSADKSCDMNICERLISDILSTNVGVDRMSAPGVYHMVSRPRFSVDIGAVQKAKEDVCGDNISVFTYDDHLLYAIISDGMGCGTRARCESDICTTLIKEFILAGFAPETAIAMTNSALCLKSETEAFATVDLCEIDLITGIAKLYKIGSAISLIYDNGDVSSVYSVSLPAGMLPHIGIKAQTKTIEDGNMILMVSDGITEAGEIKTDWLKTQLKTPHSAMQAKADDILEEAIKKSGGQIKDDMSVVCIMLKECL